MAANTAVRPDVMSEFPMLGVATATLWSMRLRQPANEHVSPTRSDEGWAQETQVDINEASSGRGAKHGGSIVQTRCDVAPCRHQHSHGKWQTNHRVHDSDEPPCTSPVVPTRIKRDDEAKPERDG